MPAAAWAGDEKRRTSAAAVAFPSMVIRSARKRAGSLCRRHLISSSPLAVLV
jgi:hypothetical protein